MAYRNQSHIVPLKLLFHFLISFLLLLLSGDSTVPYVSFAFFLYYMSSLGEVSIEILYQRRMFHFSPVTIGYFGSLSGVMQCLSMLALPPLYHLCFNRTLLDIYWIEVGLWCKAIYFVLFSSAQHGIQLFYILPILILCGPIVPRTRSYLSKAVKKGQQTELFVAVAALEAMGASIGPTLTFGYAHTVSYYPGLMFQVIAGICVCSALVILYVRTRILSQSYIAISDTMKDSDLN